MNSRLKNIFFFGIEILAFTIGITGCIFSLLDFLLFIIAQFLPIKIVDIFYKWMCPESLCPFIILRGPLIFFYLSLFGSYLAFISYKLTKKKSTKFAFYLNVSSFFFSLIVGVMWYTCCL